MNTVFRKIETADNAAVAFVIRTVLEEHNITMPGTAYHDKNLDYMCEFHSIPNSAYFVAELNGKIVGGSGVYPTNGLPHGTCELVKMYVLKEMRGKGIAKKLLEHCIAFAQTRGYKNMYLETMPELDKAVGMYEKFGFQKLTAPLGNTGHFACTLQMQKPLNV